MLALAGIQTDSVYAKEQMAVSSMSEGGLSGAEEAAGEKDSLRKEITVGEEVPKDDRNVLSWKSVIEGLELADTYILSITDGDVSGGSDASGRQEVNPSSVSSGNAQGSGEVSRGQDAGASSVSDGDAAGGAVEYGMESVGTFSVSGGDAAGSGVPSVYSMTLADSDHSGTAYGID